MPALSSNSLYLLACALTKSDAANEVASDLSSASVLADQSGLSIAALIVATSTSTTTNFAALKVGDKVLHISVAGSTNDLTTVATAGTLAEAAVVSDVYVVFRPFVAPPAASFSF
jgi:hypothetical protein